MSGLCLLMVNTSHSTSQCSRWLPPSHSWLLTLSGLVLNVQFLGALQALFLIDFSSIISFFCVSLGPWCFLLRLATLHPSQLARVRIFLRSQRRIQLCGTCLVDHGGLDAFTASFTVCSSSLCSLAALVDTRLAYIVNLLFLLNTHFHVLRADCWCSSATHLPSARCACRALSPELDFLLNEAMHVLRNDQDMFRN